MSESTVVATKRPREEEAEGEEGEASLDTKKFRHETELSAEEKKAICEASYKRLLAWIPDWLKDEPSFTLHGPIKWESWTRDFAHHGWLARALLPLAATATIDADAPFLPKELAVWLWFFAREHARNHYGSFELQVLLGNVSNDRDYPTEDLIAPLEDLLAKTATPSPKERLLVRFMGWIIHDSQQILCIYPSHGGGLHFGLRYHSLIDEYDSRPH